MMNIIDKSLMVLSIIVVMCVIIAMSPILILENWNNPSKDVNHFKGGF
jgi:uncharacterized membrane protein YvbJ